MNPMATFSYMQSIVFMFHQIKTVLLSVFPSVIGFTVAIFATSHFMRLIVWMFRLHRREKCHD